MVDPRCVDYIRTNKDKYPMDALKAALLQAGASPADVEEAVRLASAPPPPPAPIPATAPPMRRSSPASFAEIFPKTAAPAAAPSQGSAPAQTLDISGQALAAQAQGLLPRARSVVFDPFGFFRTMPRSGGWQEPIFFLVAMSLASAVLRLALGFAFGLFGSGGTGAALGFFAGIFSIFLALIVVPIAAVVVAGVAHIIWTVLGSKQPFEVSLRCIAFMSALMPVQAVVQALPVVGLWLAIPVSLYGIYLFLPASTEAHEVERGKASMVVMVFGGLALLGLLASSYSMWKMRRYMGAGTAQAHALRSLVEASQAAAASGQSPQQQFLGRLAQLQAQGGLRTGGMPGASQPQAAAQAMQALSGALGALGADNTVKAVVPDALKGLLPRELPDMKRTNAESGRQKLGPMEMAAATGVYEDAAGGKVEIQIIDAGSYSSLLSMAWGATDIDQENDAGFKRTTTYKGAKALEEYRKAEQTNSIQLIAAQRFAVKVIGHGVDMKVVHAALDAVDIDAMGRLAH